MGTTSDRIHRGPPIYMHRPSPYIVSYRTNTFLFSLQLFCDRVFVHILFVLIGRLCSRAAQQRLWLLRGRSVASPLCVCSIYFQFTSSSVREHCFSLKFNSILFVPNEKK